MRLRPFALSLIILAAACGIDRGASSGENGGTMVITISGDAEGFLPPITSQVPSAQVEAQLFDKLAEPGLGLNTIGDVGFEPRLAKSWSWTPDSLSIAFSIDPRARWHDGQRLTARDVRFTWQVYADTATGSPTRPLIASIDSVTVRDSLTAVFWFSHRAAEQFFDATYQMRIIPEHRLASVPRAELRTAPFMRHPVGSGPFRFVSWRDRQAITLEANPDYYRGRPHLDRVIWSVAPDPQSNVLRFLAGEVDLVEFLRPPDMAELPKHPELKAVPYPSLGYYYLLFNERDPKNPLAPHPLFGSRELRRALSMALDRPKLVKSVFDTLASVGHGPITKSIATFDSTIVLLPYAPDSARRILDALGWRDANGDGIREKNGRPLAFTLIIPSSSLPRRQAAQLIQEELKQFGVKVEIEMADFPTTNQKVKARLFDAWINGLSLDPSPGSIRQSWSSASATPDGSNVGSYQSPVFDAYVDSAVRQMDPVKAKAYFRQAYVTIVGDAPAIWLYEPASIAGMQRRIHPTGMRADAWGVNLAEWSIPPGERTARDRVGAAPPAPPEAPAAPAKP